MCFASACKACCGFAEYLKFSILSVFADVLGYYLVNVNLRLGAIIRFVCHDLRPRQKPKFHYADIHQNFPAGNVVNTNHKSRGHKPSRPSRNCDG